MLEKNDKNKKEIPEKEKFSVLSFREPKQMLQGKKA